jgi:hypothetical protein
MGFTETNKMMTLDPVIMNSLLGMTISEVREFQRKLRNGGFTEATHLLNQQDESGSSL